ncbi:glycosyltransferase [Candidatus Contendibacter odensensis]|uniref:Glycosyltransferase 2-like domain-containing protein n=1 Tax=Candidatus Contendobacter odensis Run_B_J11 TaxID=1400861 RepID=A0A7U7G7T4_9GAMM|nr:glycosyltransferase [Candidatus Contendobacter odensis]CDH43066.1 hypothetical protein BN874_100019 [Candidatus Contendobacter odensis Run_B_J11]
MSDPRISVLMSVHNGERFLREAVDSILNQTYTNFEFIIFDDCSTDSSLAILQSYTDPRIRIIKNDKNLGLTVSLNKGLSLAQGELIARMDADDISRPSRFEKQVVFLDQHPEVAVVGTWIECIDREGRIFKQIKSPTEPAIIRNELLRKNFMWHPTVTFRKHAAITTGGYQNKAGRFAQDYDLWLRLSDNHQIANLPEYLLLYRYHAEQITWKKLHGQIKAAQVYRTLAANRRKDRGEFIDLDLIKKPTWKACLRGRDGTLGSAYFSLSQLYATMKEPKIARAALIKALMYSPLSYDVRSELSKIIKQKFKLFYNYFDHS